MPGADNAPGIISPSLEYPPILCPVCMMGLVVLCCLHGDGDRSQFVRNLGVDHVMKVIAIKFYEIFNKGNMIDLL